MLSRRYVVKFRAGDMVAMKMNRARMKKNESFAGRKETALQLNLILGRVCGSQARLPAAESVDWDALIALAAETKTAGLLNMAFGSERSTLPKAVCERLLRIENEILHANLVNLAWTIRAFEAVRSDGIDVLVFKGVVRAHQVYGNWQSRRSGDVDLLVRKTDYLSASDALRRAGFLPLVSADSDWWHRWLGESPFVRPDGSGVVIDLHNSLQQPGGPYPRRMEDFFVNAVKKDFQKVGLCMPASQYSLLIAAISYGKSVLAGTPWLVYAHEIAYAHSRMSIAEQSNMARLARQQGLFNIYREAVANSKALLSNGSYTALAASPQHDLLIASALGKAPHHLFDRSRLNWRWADGIGLKKMKYFAREVVRSKRADWALRRFEREKAAVLSAHIP